MNGQTEEKWVKEELETLMEKVSQVYAGTPGREQAKKYVLGLLSPIERKNGWQMAECLGEKTPYALQQFLYRGRWKADTLRDRLREYVSERLGETEGVLVVDETGFLKQGKKSCGVIRQYSGTAGRIENCQVGVFLSYASAKGFTMLDRRLYMPREWMDDPERCKAAGVPKGTLFQTKAQMALTMIKETAQAGVPFAWVTGDSVYGDYRDIRIWLEAQNKGYVLSVSGKEHVWIGFYQHRISALLKELPDEGWTRESAGDGSKGQRLFDWLLIALNQPPEKGWRRHLLVRRSIAKPDELRAYVCYAPMDTPLKQLIRIAGTRWTIETSFADGSSHYLWPALRYRANAVYLRQSARLQKGAAFVRLSKNDIRKLCWWFSGFPSCLHNLLSWIHWRFIHQSIASSCHWKSQCFKLQL